MDQQDNWPLLFNNQCQTYPMPFNLYDVEQYTKEKKIQEECEQVEWEQDMGARIPFCKLNGQFCNMQCLRR